MMSAEAGASSAPSDPKHTSPATPYTLNPKPEPKLPIHKRVLKQKIPQSTWSSWQFGFRCLAAAMGPAPRCEWPEPCAFSSLLIRVQGFGRLVP